MKITWHAAMQPDNKAKIDFYFQKWNWLIPKWVLFTEICLWDSTADAEMTAQAFVNYSYRRLTLEVYTKWLDCPDDEKEFVIVHELIHAFTLPPITFARDFIDTASKDNEMLKETATAELNVRNESSTQDLAFAIYNKFNER
jgi:Zn-dependent peptidase ImmA (M78 family)